ncbi:tetratricopeptide repeat protein [Streptomyces sp. NPDC060035]|uniref:tetratricopeptide repeat protein n=1 Tax=Streptomyces sp. NPDC060035 TaxID=3347044 RepID=UPI00368FCA73
MGRRGELAVFRETFARDPEEVDFPFLFHVRGNGGVGKSTLVRQWEAAAREQTSVVTAFVDDDVHDALEAMETVSARLGQQGHPLKRFDKQLATYRQRRHQAESAAPAPQAAPGEPGAAGPVPSASPSSTVAAQVGLVGLGMLPGVGAFVGAVDPQQVALGADRMRTMLNMRLRSHDDVQLVMNPVAGLAPVFLEDLADVSERCERVVLFFDVYERTGPVLDAWLQSIVFGEEHGSLPVNVQIVLSGQLRLDARVWGDWMGQVTEVCLEVFTEEEARTLLTTHGVVDEPSIELVLRLSGRLPLLVDMLARSDPGTGDSSGDPSETAVERFLRWEPDAQRREAALACALPLQLNEDVYRSAVPEAAADGYPWLRGLAFVSSQAGRCRYHNVVRAAMLRLQRTRSPSRWQQAHTRLADTFAQWRLAAEADLGTDADEHWQDAGWREHRLNETYHRLCANSRTALPDALHQAVHAIDLDLATLRRWAQLLGQAGEDTGTAVLTSWGRRLEAAGEQDTAGVAVLTSLLNAPELDSAGRGMAYRTRSREHLAVGDYASALADCEAALGVAPDTSRNHAARGETYRLMARHEEALADCTRAIELDPDYEWAIASRGQTYLALGRHEEALADYTRAIELDPGYDWAVANRGETYRRMERFDDALADLSRALDINPQYAWALGSRGQTYQDLERYEDALADFSRALDINPQYAWALGSRGQTYQAMGRYGDALADYTRAFELDPEYAWALASRGEAYRELARFDEALVDYTRAVGINPQYAWALGSRGQTYQAMGRYEEALADYTRAIELAPRSEWIINGRAQVHLLLGRNDEAIDDCARALDIDSEDGWNVGLHAVALRMTGNEQEAQEQFRHAVRVSAAAAVGEGPKAAWARECLFVMTCALPDRDEAAAHFDALLEGEPARPLIQEMREDLALLRKLLPESGPGTDAFMRRLEEILERPATP